MPFTSTFVLSDLLSGAGLDEHGVYWACLFSAGESSSSRKPSSDARGVSLEVSALGLRKRISLRQWDITTDVPRGRKLNYLARFVLDVQRVDMTWLCS